MLELNFPKYSFKLKKDNNAIYILCQIRKKYLVLTPEEWVRQHTISYLINEIKCPISMINVEKKITINTLTKRYDIIVYYPNGEVFLIVECKSPTVQLTQTVFDQISQYNSLLSSKYIMVTNGLAHYYCQMDYKQEKYNFLEILPFYK